MSTDPGTTDTQIRRALSMTRQKVEAGLRRRYNRERRFRLYGLLSVVFGVAFLGFLLVTIIGNGYTAFRQTYLRLDIVFDAASIDPEGRADPQVLAAADYQALVKAALGRLFPQVTERRERRELNALVSSVATYQLRDMVLATPGLVGQHKMLWLPADDTVDMQVKGRTGQLSEQQAAWVERLLAEGQVDLRFNTAFFVRRFTRARAGRHLGRHQGLVLHAAGDAAAVISAGRGGRHLPGGVRAA